MKNLLSLYSGKKVLVTGHTGFKGSWLVLWLKHLGADVAGVSVNVPTKPAHFEVTNLAQKIEDYRLDISEGKALKSLVDKIQPDFVFHLAAQALVRPSYQDPLQTMTTNAIGSVNVLEALRTLEKRVVAVMVTSDKVYDNVEWVWGYRETDRLGGQDPYSASKGMAELAIRSYVASFFNVQDTPIRIGIARAGNVIGGGDWAQDRILPDCIKAWSKNESVNIRNPRSTRPWQHVLEPLSGYLTLATHLAKSDHYHGEAYNFGPTSDNNHSVGDLINAMKKYWNNRHWRDVSQNQNHLHEAGLLKLNCDKALFDLNWRPTLNFDETVEMSVQWYKTFYHNQSNSMCDYSLNQIKAYMQLAQQREDKHT